MAKEDHYETIERFSMEYYGYYGQEHHGKIFPDDIHRTKHAIGVSSSEHKMALSIPYL